MPVWHRETQKWRESGELMDADGAEWKYMALTWIWHSDSSFREVPSMGSILHGIEIPPEGGETLFCNLAAVWEALPAHRRETLAGLERMGEKSAGIRMVVC